MLKISAPAKINLALNVLSKRPDGYHEVDMVMQPLTLADEIQLEQNPEIQLSCTNPHVPVDQGNLAWKAVLLLQKEFGIATGVKIKIIKNIPVAAGLAGGSTDAAAVLIGLNQLWNLNLSTERLMELGVKLGADVPFCIMQQTARAEGIGEKLSLINSNLNCQVLLVTPNIGVSTPFVYNQLQVSKIEYHPKINHVIDALKDGDLDRLSTGWGNVLEEVVFKHFKEVVYLKKLFKLHGLKYILMSGSGPSVFALNPSEQAVKSLTEKLPPEWFWTVCEFKN